MKIAYLIVLLSMSCSTSNNEEDVYTESFDKSNRPYFTYDKERNQFLLEPWNYNLPRNGTRKYPLIVYLHGSGGAGDISYLNHLGYDSQDNNDDETAISFQKNHPCFVLIPQTNSEWDNNVLIEQVEYIKKNYRIDDSIIYLIGYSMGGSGSYSFANAYYDYNGHIFAGIIRLVGQSQTTVRNEISDKTSIWLHVGLDDTDLRIQVTREAYNNLKNYHSGAVEKVSSLSIPGYTGTTHTLEINGNDRFRLTEYENVGHNIVNIPFRDKNVMEWLFKHKLTVAIGF